MTYKQISLKLPDEILNRVDVIAKNRYKKRSEIIREAILSYIGAYKKGFEKTEGVDLLKEWMGTSVDVGPTNAKKEHDLVF